MPLIASVVGGPQPRMTDSLTVPSPGASENISWFYVETAITVTQLAAVLVGSASPSVTFSVRFGADRSAAGTEVITGGTTVTSVSVGTILNSFTVATIPAGVWVWLTTTAQSGTVTNLHVSLST